MTDIDWRNRANKLESRLMWTGAAIDTALLYLRGGHPIMATKILEERLKAVQEELDEIRAEG